MQSNKDLFGGANTSLNIKEQLLKYWANWPLIVVVVAICMGAGYVYTRYTTPKYVSTTSFLIKGNTEGSGNSSNDLIETALNGKREINLNNDILVISSVSLMQRVVAKYGFNVDYYKRGKILKPDIYLDAPFRLVPKIINNKNAVRIVINRLDAEGGIFSFGPKKQTKEYSFKWNTAFTLDDKTFVLIPKDSISNNTEQYEATWQPVETAASAYSKKLGVKAYDPKTSVIQISMLIENLQKGKDILNALFTEFNLSDIETRNKLSENTVRFIDERLAMISGELKGVEGNLEHYRGSNQLLDVQGQSAMSLENTNSVNRTIKDLVIQQNIIGMISGYFNNPGQGKLVPSSLGLNDPTLAALIGKYNEVQLKKEREAPLVAPNSLQMEDLNTQSNSLKSSIQESLNSISKNLQLQEGNLKQQSGQYQQFLSSLPRNERVLQEIKRKQNITEGLYLYLLQKREEAAISTTSTSLSHFMQLDPANGYGPVIPDTKKILLYTALLGLFLSLGWIYVRGLLNDKVSDLDDIAKNTAIPVIGEISRAPEKTNWVVSAEGRDLLGEQFRIIRTNLSLLDKNWQVLLVTSSISNEGKSFVCLNLATVLAIPGRKVALLQFDMRKPMNADRFNSANTGISQYLSGKIKDLTKIYYATDELTTLHIYPPGLVPANPADVLLSENMIDLFEELKRKYDYIIIDSAPAALVSDSFILGAYSDAVLYIIREGYTPKKQFDFINGVNKNKKLHSLGLILNDVKTGNKYGYNGYPYEGKNGYFNNKKVNGKKVLADAKQKV
jgi:capsular exopolysaccharide synthesis family protein